MTGYEAASGELFTLCDACGGIWALNPSPMFHDYVWKRIGMKPDDVLCDDCARLLLGKYRRSLLRKCRWNDKVKVWKAEGQSKSNRTRTATNRHT